MRHIMLIGLLTATGWVAQADEVGIRYNNLVNSNGVFDVDFSSSGKLVEGTYVWEPSGGSIRKNVFCEGASGFYFAGDVDSHPVWIGELSPGVQVQSGPVKLRLSQGVSYLAYPPEGVQFVTHISMSLVADTGVSVGLERSHYSTGSSGGRGYDFTGLSVRVHF